MLSESAATEAEPVELERFPTALCSPDLCAATITRAGRTWRILATRTRNYVDYEPLSRARAAADIVVSDRTLPRTCVPRWLKADKSLLRKTGALAISFGQRPEVSSVTARVGRHPWRL